MENHACGDEPAHTQAATAPSPLSLLETTECSRNSAIAVSGLPPNPDLCDGVQLATRLSKWVDLLPWCHNTAPPFQARCAHVATSQFCQLKRERLCRCTSRSQGHCTRPASAIYLTPRGLSSVLTCHVLCGSSSTLPAFVAFAGGTELHFHWPR